MEQTLDLFPKLTRDERQELGRRIWIEHKCRGTMQWPTGTGKTRLATNCIACVLKKYPNFKVIVIVPTTALASQWTGILDKLGFSLNCEVLVVNTAIKDNRVCDLLVLDECHRYAGDCFQSVFTKIKYKLILGLTATFERLDEKHKLIEKYCPVIDTITLAEAKYNGWISEYKEYQVLIEVDDIDKYIEYNRNFTENFEFFDSNFSLAMKMIGKDGFKHRLAYRDLRCPNGTKEQKSEMLKSITYHAMGFIKALSQRKEFINHHPKKIEIARKIIECRKDKKIITFSNSVDMAEQIGGPVYTGRDSKKKGRLTLEEFHNQESGIINSVAKLNEGLDCPGLSVAIILGLDSSKTKSIQRTGRVIRKEEHKVAEIFNIIILNTVECEWFKNSHSNADYITIDEANLMKVLNNEEPEPYKRPIPKMSFRF